jgi:hypothetical protein
MTSDSVLQSASIEASNPELALRLKLSEVRGLGIVVLRHTVKE